MTRGIACCSALFLLISAPAPAAPLGLVLPTDNDAIFSEDPSRFYMYTDRNFEGVLTKPWSGGAYGFTRDQKRTAAGIILTRLHEGVDIRPVKRDAAGEPLDEVRAIADGTVVYVNGSSSRSN
jgi:murein DD-endopeptidase MepM/ murein hydrolase activator NlpD